MANFAKLALCWQFSANAPAWAVGSDKQRKGSFNVAIARHQPVIVYIGNFRGILPMIQLIMVGDFGGKGGQFSGGRCQVHLCRIFGAKAESGFCHCLALKQRGGGGPCFGGDGFAGKHARDFFGSFIVT
jgi:hypothetical protein